MWFGQDKKRGMVRRCPFDGLRLKSFKYGGKVYFYCPDIKRCDFVTSINIRE